MSAIAAGIAAGAAYDLLHTEIISNYNPKGLMAAVDNAVNNPTAGNVFDAVAGIFGDGLTGYAGGNIAYNIIKNAKVNNLEAIRAAKTEQLNTGLSGGASMSSGKAALLGDQINALTSQIDALKVNTPQYFWDRKTKQFVVEYPNAIGGGPVIPIPNKQNRVGKVIICQLL